MQRLRATSASLLHISFSIGGDLDGDLYFVTWSDDFKPRRDIHKPMDYPALRKKEHDGPITVQDMVDFYAEYIQCDALGKYDHIFGSYFKSEYKDYAGFQSRAV